MHVFSKLKMALVFIYLKANVLFGDILPQR